MPDVTLTLTEGERDLLVVALMQRMTDANISKPDREVVEKSARAKLRAAVPVAPGPLERLEAWLRRSSKNHFEFERFNGAWVVRLYNYDVDCATSAPTLSAAIDAALRQAEEEVSK